MKKDNQMIGELNILFLVPTYLLIVLGHYMYPNYSVSQTHKSILNLFVGPPSVLNRKSTPFLVIQHIFTLSLHRVGVR